MNINNDPPISFDLPISDAFACDGIRTLVSGNIEVCDRIYPSEAVTSDGDEGARESEQGELAVPFLAGNNSAALLAEMFPHVSTYRIAEVLRETRSDLVRALALLVLHDDEDCEHTTGGAEEAVSAAAGAETGRPVCRYFLQGTCLRADCAFAHHTQQTTCKFWLQGACLNASCGFLHSLGGSAPEPAATRPSSVKEPQSGSGQLTVPLVSEEEFPSILGSFDWQASKADNSDWSSGGRNIATTLRLGGLGEQFPSLSPATIEAVFEECREDCTHACRILRERFPHAIARDTAALSHNGGGKGIPMRAAQKARLSSAAAELGDQGWSETGGAVARLYEDVRKEAFLHASIKYKFFHAATQAFVHGDGAAARALSRLGREHHDRMHALHRQACQAIFGARNAAFGAGFAKGQAPRTLDLHGLHVAEALSFVEAALEQTSDRIPYLYIITGTGHHSRSGRTAKVPNAVKKLLACCGYSYVDCSTDRRGGMLKVAVS